MNNFRLNASTTILNLAERLPRFRKGFISDLQRIREQQRQWAEKAYDARKAPDGAQLNLDTLVLALTFEHEDFKTLVIGLRKYFPKNQRIQKFISELKNSVDNLQASSWSNLGVIVKTPIPYLQDVTVDRSIPNNVKYIHLSFHRILPSMACIIFSCQLDDNLSKELKTLQDKIYLGTTEFKKFFPLKESQFKYTMSPASHISRDILNNKKNETIKDIESWIKKSFKWKDRGDYSISYIDIYKLSGCPLNNSELNKWLRNNQPWLKDFDISPSNFSSLMGDDFLLSKSDHQEYSFSTILTLFEKQDEKSDSSEDINSTIDNIVISITIQNLIDKYSEKIKSLRSSGFENLYKRTKLTNKTQENIQEIKRTLVLLSRLNQELQQSKPFISHSLDTLGELKNNYEDVPKGLGVITFINVDNKLNQIKEAAHIIDAGLTNYLSTQSIYVMYKLQKWMFLLTIVVTVATIIGVMSGWQKTMEIISGWF